MNESVKSMQVDGENIKTIDSGLVGIKVDNLVRENDHVYLKKDIKED